MRQAIIRINIKGFPAINEAVCYEPQDEEKKLMGLARSRIKREVPWALRGLVPRGRGLMAEIVQRCNDHFKFNDPTPKDWPDFREWAIRRGFLEIKEIEAKDGRSGETRPSL